MSDGQEFPVCPITVPREIPRMYYVSKYIPVVDTCNTAPQPDHLPPMEKFERFVMRKVCSEPRWSAHPPYPSPCNLPLNENSLAPHILSRYGVNKGKKIVDHYNEFNTNHLSSIKVGDKTTVLLATDTPEGSDLAFHDVLQHSSDVPLITLDKTMTFKKKNIYDIESECVANNAYVLTRMKQGCQLHIFEDNCLKLCSDGIGYLKSSFLTSATLALDMPAHWLQADDKLTLTLRNGIFGNKTINIWSCTLPEKIDRGTFRWSSAKFCTPSNYGVAVTRTNVYTCDFRKEGVEHLFDLFGTKSSVKPDDIRAVVPVDGRPYVLTVASEQVILLDQRNCKLPVMAWGHMLSQAPKRASLERFNDLDLLMLGNDLEKRVSLIGVTGCSHDYTSFIKSECFTNHCDLYNPMKTVAHTNGLWFDPLITDRLKYDFTGLTSLNELSSPNTLDVLVCNSVGDVFSQHFRIGSDSQDNNSSSVLPEYQKRYERWEELLVNESMKTVNNTLQTVNVTGHVGDKLLTRTVRKKKGRSLKYNNGILDGHWQLAQMVDLYRAENKRLNKPKVLNTDWLTILLADYKADDEHVLTRVPLHVRVDAIKKHFSTRIGITMNEENLEQCNDALAKTILEHWCDNNNDAFNSNDPLLSESEDDGATEVYHALPYSRKLHPNADDLPKKFKPGRRSRATSTVMVQTEASSSTAAAAPFKKPPSQNELLQKFLSKHLPPSTQPLSVSHLSATVGSLTTAPPASIISQSTVPASFVLGSGTVRVATPSTVKKKKRNAGF